MVHPALTIITTSFPISGDGSEAAGAFVADLVEEIAKHIPVRVVAPGPITVREQWSKSIEVFRYASPSRPLSTLKPWWPKDQASIIKVLHGGMQVTRQATKDSNHILALWGLPSGEWARRISKETGIGYSVWLLGSDVWTLGRIPLLRGALARVIKQARHAYADGYQLAEDARAISARHIDFLPSTRTIHLKNPPPPRSQAPYNLLFLGRWHSNKGIDLLLDALQLLSECDWQRIESVEIQGGGPLQSLVREQVAQLQTAGRPVILGGYLAKPQAEEAIVRADWVLIPSRIESIPVVFSDALKLGRPVLAMPVGDLPSLIQESGCGVLATSVTADDFAQGISQAVQASTADFSYGITQQAAQFDLIKLALRIVQKVRI